jgi:hypothetical protein
MKMAQSSLENLVIAMSEDLKLRLAYAKDSEAVMAEYGLAEEEKAALRSGDEAAVHGAIGAASASVFAKLIWSRPKVAPDGAAFAKLVWSRPRNERAA